MKRLAEKKGISLTDAITQIYLSDTYKQFADAISHEKAVGVLGMGWVPASCQRLVGGCGKVGNRVQQGAVQVE